MALVKCSECGNEVSEMATMCPHCGNPIRKKQKAKVPKNLVLSIWGYIIIAFSPLLTYVTVGLNFPGSPSKNSYNMWRVLTPEAGGLKSGESAGLYGFVPTLIVILGIVGVLLSILQIVKKTEIKKIYRAMIPVIATVFFALFETIGLQTFRNTNNEFAKVFSKNGLDGMLTITKGIGFYLFIIGAVVSFVATFIKPGKKIREGGSHEREQYDMSGMQ